MSFVIVFFMAFIMNVKVLKSLMFKRYDDWYFYTFTTNISNREKYQWF